ncbi:hypothetical protein Fmac_002980 [Flemingia macrophylla]|uniref:Legume lectin domain-containing protein n=1 Tax=Flemingia macrophylla TaxID=520843 RepID=A0ABD1NPC8_9FABA
MAKLHETQNPFAVFLMTFIFSLSLITSVKSDSFSFSIHNFQADAQNIFLAGDAKASNEVLRLTKTDPKGFPLKHSVGLSIFEGVIHLSDRKTGRVANFNTEFNFMVNTEGATLHGDGFAFFLAANEIEISSNSSGGFLGLFNYITAFKTTANPIVAVEFDSFANQWDPSFPVLNSPHIGIDINSIRSVATAPWTLDVQPIGIVGKARISYQSSSKILTVSVAYPDSPVNSNVTVLSYPVDLGAVLPEWVIVGFAAATGDVRERTRTINEANATIFSIGS